MAAIRAYGDARREFCKLQKEIPALLQGNDNKVGVAGEFWAKWHYAQLGYHLIEVPLSNNPGYDFRCANDAGELRVNVKVVSDESTRGRQLPLKASDAWDEVALLLLNGALTPYMIGRATRAGFDKAVAAGKIGPTPFVTRNWVGPKGWMQVYGIVQKVGDPTPVVANASVVELTR